MALAEIVGLGELATLYQLKIGQPFVYLPNVIPLWNQDGDIVVSNASGDKVSDFFKRNISRNQIVARLQTVGPTAQSGIPNKHPRTANEAGVFKGLGNSPGRLPFGNFHFRGLATRYRRETHEIPNQTSDDKQADKG